MCSGIFRTRFLFKPFVMYQNVVNIIIFLKYFVQHSALGRRYQWVTVVNDYANNNFIAGRYSRRALSDLWQTLFEAIANRTVLRFHYLETDAPEGRKSDDFKRQHNVADFYLARRKWPVKFFFVHFLLCAAHLWRAFLRLYIFYILFFTIEPQLVMSWV